MNLYTYCAVACIFSATASASTEFKDLTNYTNLALGQSASQSSTGWQGVADRAVDGDKNSSYHGKSCTHTNKSPLPQWWAVELKQEAEVYQVKIMNRIVAEQRLRDFNILVGYKASPDDLEVCAYFEGPGESETEYTFNCATPLVGDYLKIQKVNDTDYLTLCEVEVLGWPIVAGCSEAGPYGGHETGTYPLYPCGAESGHKLTTCVFDESGAWVI